MQCWVCTDTGGGRTGRVELSGWSNGQGGTANGSEPAVSVRFVGPNMNPFVAHFSLHFLSRTTVATLAIDEVWCPHYASRLKTASSHYSISCKPNLAWHDNHRVLPSRGARNSGISRQQMASQTNALPGWPEQPPPHPTPSPRQGYERALPGFALRGIGVSGLELADSRG